MPVYCYVDDEGVHYDIEMTIEEKWRKEITCRDVFGVCAEVGDIIHCGNKVHRDIGSEHKQFKHTYGATWPMESDAAGVHPDQIPEAVQADREAGIRHTEYNPDTGNPIFVNAGHRREYCEAHGLYDRNAGFSDPVPQKRKEG